MRRIPTLSGSIPINVLSDVNAKIFDLFYSADSVSGGNGLGLSIAQAIAKAHDGMITVSNNSQRGAEFIVILPVA